VNTAVHNGNGSTVLCFASGSYGDIDLYSDNPSGTVTLLPAAGAAATGLRFNLNGTHNITIENFAGLSNISGGVQIVNSGQGDSTNISILSNNMGSGEILVKQTAGTANANILIQGNTIIGYNDVNDTGAIMVGTYPGCPDGVTVKNNTIVGTVGDGLSTEGSSCGTQFIGNDVSGFLAGGGCNPSQAHCDAFQDNGGGQDIVLDSNYFHNNINCFQITDGDTNLTYTNNVCISGPGAGYTGQISSRTLLFKHNTIISPGLNIHAGNDSGGNSASNFTVTDNIFNGGQFLVNGGQTITGTFTQDYNLCFSGGCTGSHSVSGTPTFVGGANPITYSGFALGSTSLGHNAGDSGSDMGINVSSSNSSQPNPPIGLVVSVQ